MEGTYIRMLYSKDIGALRTLLRFIGGKSRGRQCQVFQRVSIVSSQFWIMLIINRARKGFTVLLQ